MGKRNRFIMDYEDFLPQYPDTDDARLQQKLLDKKEFFDFRIQTLAQQVEAVPREVLQRHQQLIQRFLSPHTPYDELFLYHETGTGKTRAAFAATDGSGFAKVFFLARGDDQLKNARAELVKYYKSTSRFQNLQPSDPETPISVLIERALGGMYEFWTWKTFTSRKIAPLSDEVLLRDYNNTIFIVDEVHNIRRVSKKYPVMTPTYASLHRLFHVVTNRKIILMSGTPMRDTVSDLANVMNFILPLEQQLRTGAEFVQRYVDGSRNEILFPDELKSALQGRVSFLRAVPDTGVQRIFMGVFVNPQLPTDSFRYFPTTMQDLQQQGYQRAFDLTASNRDPDAEEELEDADYASNFYSDPRQAALFVFPDGSWGIEGYQRYVHRQPDTVLARFVRPIDQLRQHSSKYAFIVEQLISNQPPPLMYVYSSLVAGSGLKLFARILELYGFQRCTGKESAPGRRYMLLTSKKEGGGDINMLIRYFNHERNRQGDYCRVILGSKIISEGFTFKNVRCIHILTLHWNYTETQQAIARAIRFGSHEALVDHPAQNIPVEVYQHVSLTGNETPSIDLQMLTTAQKKDILSRRMTRLIKEISVDCPLVYARNVPTLGETRDIRDCDYLPSCEYECEQVETAENVPVVTDWNTYRLYYQESSDLEVWNGVRRYFERSTGLPVDFRTIEEHLQVDWFQLVRVLSDMIRFNVPVVNAYGFECYLREDHNQYYLVENILLPNNQRELSWYAHQPSIVETTSLQRLLQQRGVPIYQRRIQELRLNPNAENAPALVQSLPIPLRELYRSLQQQQRQENVQNEPEVFQSAVQRGLEYYGTVDQNDKFRIVDIRGATDEVADVRKYKSGSVCLESGFNKDRIIHVYFSLGVDVPLPEGFDATYPDPLQTLETLNYGPKLISELNLRNRPVAEQYVVIRLLLMSKSELCTTLREWMRSQDLLASIIADVRGTRKTKIREVRRG